MSSSRVRKGRHSSSLAVGELERVRPVDRERVDGQPVERLAQRLAGPPEEGDALLHLSRLRPVLEQEDVGARMAGAEDRNALALAGARDLVRELVDLGDRLLEVLLGDFVSSHSRHRGRISILV